MSAWITTSSVFTSIIGGRTEIVIDLAIDAQTCASGVAWATGEWTVVTSTYWFR